MQRSQVLSELKHLRIPIIEFPWQGGCAPDVERLEARLQRWLIEYGLVPIPEHRARAERARYATLVARCHPHAQPELLQTLTDFTTWLFVVDDFHLDRVDPHHDATLPSLTSFLDVLDLEQVDSQPIFGQDALADLCRRWKVHLSAEHYARLAHGMRMWVASAAMQVIGQRQKRPLSPSTYCAIRRHVGGMNPCMAVIDAANAGSVTAEEYYQPAVERLRLHMNNIVVWSNDMHSIHVEAHEPGQRQNFVLLQVLQGRSLQESVDSTERRIHEEIEAFQHEALRLERHASRELKGYISGQRDWMSGYQSWVDHDTHRYSAQYAEQDADDRDRLSASR